jgi:dihydroneopterin aldolase
MSDLIRIVDLKVMAHIGVPDEERREPQALLVTLELAVDSIGHAGATDNVARTVNYFDVAERVKAVALERARRLIETLAEDLVFDLFQRFPLDGLTLEIKKFILPDARYVSVKVSRTRP